MKFQTKSCYRPYPWARYSKKLIQKIGKPQFMGSFTQEDAERTGIRLVLGSYGAIDTGCHIVLYALIDEMDGVIADIKYHMTAPSALTGILEAACHLILRKNYDQARRITCNLIEKELCDKPEEEGVPVEFYGYLNHVIEAVDAMCEKCTDIAIDDTALSSPLLFELTAGEKIEGFELLPKLEKLRIIELVIEKDIRPYIELDEGGVQIIDLSEDHKLTIAYQGSCVSCYSATGSTLSAIQQILRSKVYPDLEVIPDLSSFSSGATE